MKRPASIYRRAFLVVGVALVGVVGCAGSSESGGPAAAQSSGAEDALNQRSAVVPPSCDSVSGAAAVADIEIAEMHDVTDTVADEIPGRYTLVCNANLSGQAGLLTVQIAPTPRDEFDRKVREIAEGPFQGRPLPSDALGPDAHLSGSPDGQMVVVDAWRAGEQLTVALRSDDGSADATDRLMAFADVFGTRLGWDVAAD